MVVAAPRAIPDSGLRTAQALLIGESPGKYEYIKQRPFVGASGDKLEQWWGMAGMGRDAFYITNVYPYYPKSMGYSETGKVPLADRKEHAARLHERIAGLTGLRVIVPTGNLALNALMGWPLNSASITKYRGSVLDYKGIPVVPTLHPAHLLRGAAHLEPVCRRDWQKVGRVLRGETITGTPRHATLYRPDSWEWRECYEATVKPAAVIAVDIETLPKDGVIDCVGFAGQPDRALVVPTWFPDYESKPDLDSAWDTVREIVAAHPGQFVYQSPGFYDPYWLWKKHGIDLGPLRWNTYWMHHAIDSAGGQHDLAFIASLYTNEPYWKDEQNGPRDERLRYNGKDNCITVEIFHELYRELERTGYLWFYEQHYAALSEPLFEMVKGGMKCDGALRKKMRAAAVARCKEIEAAITEVVGHPLHAAKSISTKKLQAFLYDECKMPLQKKRGKPGEKARPSTDAIAMRRLIVNHRGRDSRVDIVAPLVIEHRLLQKRESTFLVGKIEDSDGRVRCDYKLVPETGRVSSGLNACGNGMNLANVPEACRPIFVADDGCVLLEMDLSTAEDRVVKMLTRDPKLVEMARRHPADFDQHRSNAAMMFGLQYTDESQPHTVDKDKRQLAKRTTHGTNYDMGPETMSEQWLKDGVIRTEDECAELKRLYIERVMPQLPEWHAEIRREVMREKVLVNTWGRRLDLTHAKLDNDTYRRAYAFKPQSEVGALLMQYGLIPMHRWLKDRRDLGARIALQLYDALYVCVPWEGVWEVAVALRGFLERPRMYYGQPMTIPVTTSVSWRWGGREKREFKAWPEREELEAAARGIYEGRETV